MAGAELLGLQYPVERGVFKGALQQIAAVTVNQMNVLRADMLRGVNHVLHHRLPGQSVQHFWKIGVHARAFASGKDHNAHSMARHSRPVL